MALAADIDSYFAEPDAHEASRERASGMGAGLLFSLLLTLAHGFNIYLFAADIIPLFLVVVIHIALVVVTGVLARGMIVKGLDSRFLTVLFVSTMALGAFGAVGTLLAIVLYRLHMRTAQPFIEWFNTMFPTRDTSVSEQIYDDIIIGRDESPKPYSVVPFMDVMIAGSDGQKREAISKMTMRFDPSFAPAFRAALGDASNSVRVQAATAVARIEHQFSSRLMKLTELHRRMPNDGTVLRALAEHYDDYAFTGILDPERERLNRESALKYYLEYLNIAPRDERARVQVGRLLLRAGDASRAAGWLGESLRDGHRSDALLGWYAEALYAAGGFTELRNLVRQFPGLAGQIRPYKPEVAEALDLWARQGVAA